MTPGKVISILLIATILALALVWQAAWRRQNGYRLDELRCEIAEQKAQRATYRNHISKLRNPRRITELAEQHGLELHRPIPPGACEWEKGTDGEPATGGSVALQWGPRRPGGPTAEAAPVAQEAQ
jgi:cell division protein FtsL